MVSLSALKKILTIVGMIFSRLQHHVF